MPAEKDGALSINGSSFSLAKKKTSASSVLMPLCSHQHVSQSNATRHHFLDKGLTSTHCQNCDQLRRRLSDKDSKNAELSDELEKMKTLAESLQRRLSIQEEDQRSLQEDFNAQALELDQRDATIVQLQAKLAALETSLSTNQRSFSINMTNDLQGSKANRISKLETECNQIRTENQRLLAECKADSDTQISQLKERIVLLESEREKAIEVNKLLQTQLLQTKNDYETKIGRLKAQIDNVFSGNSKERQQQLEEISKKLKASQEECDALRTKLVGRFGTNK